MRSEDRFAFRGLVVAAILAAIAAAPTLAAVVPNDATGDIAGDAGALTPAVTFNLDVSTLALIKTAFLANGTQLTSGANIPKGTLVKFMIYVNNNTPIGVSDLSVQDVLAASFAYQTGTIKVDNTVNKCAVTTCTALEEAAIFAAVDDNTALTDAADGPDVASYTVGTTTIDVGNGNVGGNGQVNIAADKVWVVQFTVQVQ